MTALIVEIKTKNIPEAPTALGLIGSGAPMQELNLIDGDNKENN
jgi:hypothetical protein